MSNNTPNEQSTIANCKSLGSTHGGLKNELTDSIAESEFRQWYRSQQRRKNIEAGKPYFNTPAPVPEPTRHSPSRLLQCHRKAFYRAENAPEEGTSPEGLFWIGSEFEEQIIVPFLKAVSTPGTYVQNSLWVDTTVETPEGDSFRIKGSTDPALVTAEGEPLLVTEVKTTSALDRLSEPRKHHRAQLHAYLYGLNKKYDHSVKDGIIIYGDRTTLEVKIFEVSFDQSFWEEVVIDWMRAQTGYRRRGELPPADPVYNWECNVCSFRHRCGKADTPYGDEGSIGFLPSFADYEEKHVVDHLEAHKDNGAKLTPILASKYPDLLPKYPIEEWTCNACDNTFRWGEVKRQNDLTSSPVCPTCASQGELNTLSM